MSLAGATNLRPAWGPGQSGNPSGRPKAVLRPLILAELEKEIRVGAVTVTQAEALVANLVGIARSPKRQDAVAAAKLILSYVDGPPQQEVSVTGEVEHGVSISAVRRAIGLAGA